VLAVEGAVKPTSCDSCRAAAMTQSRSRGLAGLGASLIFLGGISLCNDRVQAYKGKGTAKDAHVAAGLTHMLRTTLGQTCGWREALTIFKLSLMLLLRTGGSVWVSRQWGLIVQSLVKRDFPTIHRQIMTFAGGTTLLALLNALLKFYIALLKQEVREKITLWCHERYMRPNDMIYYKANKVGDDKIEHCDHQITSDVDRFSEMFTEVLSQSLKPVVDFMVYSYELSRVQGLTTPLTLYAWYSFASAVSASTLPPYGELVATEQRLEGRFRSAHSAIIANCEQIAFLGGEVPERRVLDEQFRTLLNHCRHTINVSFGSEVIRQYLNKYFVTVIGLLLICRPVRLNLNGANRWSADQIAQYFTSTWRNMELMSTSIQDLFELSNRVGRLSGFASRLCRLMGGLQERPFVLQARLEQARRGPFPPSYQFGENLKFSKVSIYRPDGTLLVRHLDFSVQKGQRVLVTGANGCGKSSLFRVLRKLWPLVEGTVVMPADKEIYFLSQVNFVPLGTLRDLVTYPYLRDDMVKHGRTDDDIRSCLRWAHVSPDVVKQGRADLEFTEGEKIVRPRLDDVRDWQKDLSPGQKQRVAFARLFYHRPSFVVLDECTNGISPDVEHDLYDRCSKLNLAVFSISHKNELKLFHEFELHYQGDHEGTWTFGRCSVTDGNITRSESRVRFSSAELLAEKQAKDNEASDEQPAATWKYERHLP